MDAAGLGSNEQLNTPGNGRVNVLSSNRYTAALRTYNLTVDTVHTFYVLAGTTLVLAHNTAPCNLYDGDGWQHVLRDHVDGSPGVDPEATLFDPHLDPDGIGDLIEDTISTNVGHPNTPDPVTGQPRSGVVYEDTFGGPVGRRQDGTLLYNIRAVLNDDGSLRTAFPL